MAIKSINFRDSAVKIAGNTTIMVLPKVADETLRTVTVAELEAGLAIECAIRGFKITGEPKEGEDQWLCDEDVVTMDGSTKYKADPLAYTAGDPQKTDELRDMLAEGSIVFFVRRDGVAHADDFTADQLGHITKAKISLIEPGEVKANADGQTYENVVTFSVKAHENWAKVIAA